MVSFPDPNASREEIERYMRGMSEARQQQRQAARLASFGKRRCSSCGIEGHSRGVAICPNYNTPWRWLDKGDRYDLRGDR